MKFEIKRDDFKNGLQQVLNVVSARATMPILGNVLIEAQGKEVVLTTTNLDLGVRCHISASISEEGAITLPVRKLATIVKELPKTEVQFHAMSENQANIRSGGSQFRIMGIGKEEFPPLPNFSNSHTFEVSQKDLLQMLKSVSYAQSTDENRYILNGVYFNFAEGKLSLVATDGRRLALISKETNFESSEQGSIIVPAKTVMELERILGQGDLVKIAFNERQVAFEVNLDKKEDQAGLVKNIYLVSKVVEGNYPNYRQVIPKETVHRIKVERELMCECVNRAALVVSDKNNSIRFKVSNNLLEVSGSSPEFGDSHESVAVKYEGPSVEMGFSPQFMIEPLRALKKDEVFFEFKDELSPGVFKTNDNFMCVVMPRRLN